MDVVFVLGGGIGNIVQATPAIQSAASNGFKVDLCLCCNSTNDLEIFNLSCVREFVSKQSQKKYLYQFAGPFTPGIKFQADVHISSRQNYAQHLPEAEIYFNLLRQIGINEFSHEIKINVGNSGYEPTPETIAIYPGSKPDWSMKRWDKYDELSKSFKEVIVVGSQEDIDSHGDPAWIKEPWDWPSHVKFVTQSLKEMSYTLSKCKMFIGNDGGLSHVAAATGIPTHAIFGPTSDIKNKPYCSNSHVIALDLECRPCQFKEGEQIFGQNKSDCPLHMKCMKDMSVDYVLSKI